jgi:hypothetical protein
MAMIGFGQSVYRFGMVVVSDGGFDGPSGGRIR